MSESEWLPPLITVVGAAFVGFAGLVAGWLFFVRGNMATKNDINGINNTIHDMNTRLGNVEGKVSIHDLKLVERN